MQTSCLPIFFQRNKKQKGIEINCVGECRSWTHVVSDTTLPMNQWVHLAGVYDGNEVSLFVNGVKQNKIVEISGILHHSANPLLLGVTMDKHYLIHRLLYRALIEIRENSHENNNMVSFHLADLFHNIPLRLQNASIGKNSPEEILAWLVNRAKEKKCENWLNNAIKEEGKYC